MSVRIKICGITQYEDARIAASLGADALGFIFYPKSPRYISPVAAKEIITKLPPLISKVGVFVNEPAETIMAITQESGIDTIQLHGTEPPEFCKYFPLPVIKAFSIDSNADITLLEKYDVSGFLLDTWDKTLRGGTGKTFDWAIAEKTCRKYPNIILAGGLGPTNIAEALENVMPYAVDVNSGVEIKPGIKNPKKLKDTIGIVKNWK
ncbi:MAG: phosphoribosylanthranilate isomerase [Chitinivibrionales bacterium]|nr:phosphoribosylanthranilate isomerase [Chitinivibrionales bacterium]